MLNITWLQGYGTLRLSTDPPPQVIVDEHKSNKQTCLVISLFPAKFPKEIQLRNLTHSHIKELLKVQKHLQLITANVLQL